MRGTIPAGFKPRLLGLLGLGLLQGAVGWWMVKSGLTGDADVKVSHFRLATHLLLALFTLTYATWTALDMQALARGRKGSYLPSAQRDLSRHRRRRGCTLIHIVLLVG